MQLSKSKAVQITRQPPERKPEKRETHPINQTGQLPPTSLRRVWLKQRVNPAADGCLIGPTTQSCQRPFIQSSPNPNKPCGGNKCNDSYPTDRVGNFPAHPTKRPGKTSRHTARRPLSAASSPLASVSSWAENPRRWLILSTPQPAAG